MTVSARTNLAWRAFIRHDAVIARAALVAEFPASMDFLQTALRSEDDEACGEALVAITQLGSRACGLLPLLIGLLEEEGGDYVCRPIAAMGADASSAVPALMKWLRLSPLPDIVVEALGSIGPSASGGVDEILEYVASNLVEPDTAEWALGRMGEAAVPALLEALRSATSRQLDARFVARALASAGQNDLRAIELLDSLGFGYIQVIVQQQLQTVTKWQDVRFASTCRGVHCTGPTSTEAGSAGLAQALRLFSDVVEDMDAPCAVRVRAARALLEHGDPAGAVGALHWRTAEPWSDSASRAVLADALQQLGEGVMANTMEESRGIEVPERVALRARGEFELGSLLLRVGHSAEALHYLRLAAMNEYEHPELLARLAAAGAQSGDTLVAWHLLSYLREFDSVAAKSIEAELILVGGGRMAVEAVTQAHVSVWIVNNSRTLLEDMAVSVLPPLSMRLLESRVARWKSLGPGVEILSEHRLSAKRRGAGRLLVETTWRGGGRQSLGLWVALFDNRLVERALNE